MLSIGGQGALRQKLLWNNGPVTQIQCTHSKWFMFYCWLVIREWNGIHFSPEYRPVLPVVRIWQWLVSQTGGERNEDDSHKGNQKLRTQDTLDLKCSLSDVLWLKMSRKCYKINNKLTLIEHKLLRQNKPTKEKENFHKATEDTLNNIRQKYSRV